MSDTKAFYIVTVGGGKCLDNTQSADGVLDCLPNESDSQRWFIETNESDPDVVAFKSCVDEKYLRNNEPKKINWGKIGMGEKQWWTLEKGKNPGSCLIRSNECTPGASYLNDFEGVYRDRNYVHMWQMVKERQYWLDWYIVPTDAVFNPKVQPSAEMDRSFKEDAEQRQRDLDAREAALKTKEVELAEREEALGQKQATISDNGSAAEAGSEGSKDGDEQRMKELDARDNALRKKEKQLADQEEALRQQREKTKRNARTANPPSNDSSDSNAKTKTTESPKNSPSPGQLELLKAENENLKLKLKVQDLERQLRDTQKPTAKAESTAPPPRRSQQAQTNGAVNGKKKKEPIVYECGHVAYPPPRKLNKHVVGMLYEGLDRPFELSERQRATLGRHSQHHRD